mmetsp:Transcript_15882/g.37152  ORF Transcript_15882/g.37152 Transcript_15882/m.37152 type:complete len:246 (-) Transcript_15882:790-1527(-)
MPMGSIFSPRDVGVIDQPLVLLLLKDSDAGSQLLELKRAHHNLLDGFLCQVFARMYDPSYLCLCNPSIDGLLLCRSDMESGGKAALLPCENTVLLMQLHLVLLVGHLHQGLALRRLPHLALLHPFLGLCLFPLSDPFVEVLAIGARLLRVLCSNVAGHSWARLLLHESCLVGWQEPLLARSFLAGLLLNLCQLLFLCGGDFIEDVLRAVPMSSIFSPRDVRVIGLPTAQVIFLLCIGDAGSQLLE